MNITEDDYNLLALSMIEGLGSIRIHHLLQKFHSAKNIFSLKKSDFKQLTSSIPQRIIEDILSRECFVKAEKEIAFCNKHDLTILTKLNSEFPPRLAVLDDKPIVLYSKGNIYPKIKKTLAVVGTRKSTEYGHKFMDSLFEEIRDVSDLAVISGLALGIDYRAHSLSLNHKIPTVAIMGLPLNKIYPSQNTNLARNILQSGGGWISETSSQDIATQGVFSRRNRLIAALADALIVIETDIKGGSIITANLANDYNKNVYALPGRVSDPQSRGCNQLISSNLASLLNNPHDLIQDMGWKLKSNKTIPRSIELDFKGGELQKKVLDTIRIYPKIDIENLANRTGILHGKLVEILLDLELENWIVALPGNQYELV